MPRPSRPAARPAALAAALGAALFALPAAALTCAPPEETRASRSDAADLVLEGRAVLGARLSPAPLDAPSPKDLPKADGPNPPKPGASFSFRVPSIPQTELWAVTVTPIAAMKGQGPEGAFDAVWRKGPCDIFTPSGDPQVLFFV